MPVLSYKNSYCFIICHNFFKWFINTQKPVNGKSTFYLNRHCWPSFPTEHTFYYWINSAKSWAEFLKSWLNMLHFFCFSSWLVADFVVLSNKIPICKRRKLSSPEYVRWCQEPFLFPLPATPAAFPRNSVWAAGGWTRYCLRSCSSKSLLCSSGTQRSHGPHRGSPWKLSRL